MKTHKVLLIGFLSLAAGTLHSEPPPVRFAIVGLVHDHARGFIPTTSSRQDIQLVAIVEPNQELAARYAKDYKLADGLFYKSLEAMLDRVKPQAVAAFTSTFDHRRVVETCASRGDVLEFRPQAAYLKSITDQTVEKLEGLSRQCVKKPEAELFTIRRISP